MEEKVWQGEEKCVHYRGIIERREKLCCAGKKVVKFVVGCDVWKTPFSDTKCRQISCKEFEEPKPVEIKREEPKPIEVKVEEPKPVEEARIVEHGLDGDVGPDGEVSDIEVEEEKELGTDQGSDWVMAEGTQGEPGIRDEIEVFAEERIEDEDRQVVPSEELPGMFDSESRTETESG